MSTPSPIHIGQHELRIESADLRGFDVAFASRQLAAGLHVVTLALAAPVATAPPTVTVSWHHPTIDVQGLWHPDRDGARALPPNWRRPLQSIATQHAPVMCLYSQAGRNRLTFACSDAMNVIETMAGVVEETAQFHCFVRFFSQPHPPLARYAASILLDTREVPYYESLDHVQRWWAGQKGYEPSQVPDVARLPMYSTWYSFHQPLVVQEVVKQCRLAKEIGCEAVIVDDGWQTTDAARGYAFCGDWRPDRIPDMKGFVRAVHDVGMKFILWYSVPFVGTNSAAFARFKDKLLGSRLTLGAAVLDPRFPDVREYLIDTYERAMRDWDLDGFKLDFVDMFAPGDDTQQSGAGRDIDSVPAAADRLLSDVMQRLRAIKPDVMVEFRQSYTGPLMRKYGNMFRAGDCPNDAISNRLKTLGIRLLCGNTAAHADMLMWNADEPVEAAALQVLNILFAVPQVSVLLDKVPASHRQMLRHWLTFWRAHRAVLLDSALRPLLPQALYPLVIASNDHERIVAIYDPMIVNPGAAVPGQLYLINATRDARIVLELDQPLAERTVQTYDTMGNRLSLDRRAFARGLHHIPVPPAGMVTFG